jgi:small-conductance mechanosensitive channel
MLEAMNDFKNEIKEVVNPFNVGKKIASPWQDFWNFEVVTTSAGDHVTVGTIVVALICLVLGIVIAKWLSKRVTQRIFRRFQMTPSSQHLWSSVSFYVFSLFVTLLVLKIAHVPLTIFTLIGGALALGVGFGSQNLVNNFMSGVMFLFEAPVKVGEFIEIDGFFGRVADVGMRATQIEVGMSRRVIVPNSFLLEKAVVNWGKPGSPIYISVNVNVHYGINLKMLETLLRENIKDIPQSVEDLPLLMQLKNFGEYCIQLDIRYPVRIYSPVDREVLASHLRIKLDELFRREKISMPFPQWIVHQGVPPVQE